MPASPNTPQRATKADVFAGTLLLVEDEAAIRQLLKRILEHAGFRVLDAESGRAALKLLVALPERIDVLVTDLNMPDLSGWEVARAVRARYPRCGVVYVTGDTEADQIVVPEAGEFLHKPFTPLELLSAVAAQRTRALA